MSRVFIVGAGFSYYLSGGSFPLMKELGEEFKANFSWVSDYLTEEEFVEINIESLLTKLDLKILDLKSSEDISRTNQHIIDIKSFLLERLSLYKIKDTQIESSMELCQNLFNENDTIINFNYDCFLENILWRIKFWSPNGGYGNSRDLNVARFGSSIEANSKNIIILKPHGSTNFLETGSGSDRIIKPMISNELFPDINSNWNLWEEDSPPPIVLPSYIKIFGENRTFISMWHEAIEKIRNTEIINIIGYSFPKYDNMTRFLLSFLNADEFKNNGIKKLKINILNKGSDSEKVWQQIYEVGMFGYDDIEKTIFTNADENDYEELCKIQT